MPQAQILPKFLLCLIFGGMACIPDVAHAQRSPDQGSDRGGTPSFGGPPPGFSGGPPGFGGGPPSPERMFGFMDRNQDGRVTEEEVPSFLRDRLREGGVDLRRGLNQEELGRAFDRARQERESSSGNSTSSSSSDRGRYDGGSNNGISERSRDDQNRSRGGSGPYVSSQKPRLTLDMPLSYADGDLDGDGQIGFYEWRKWRRNQTETFFVIDSNSDGFLTPAELSAAPTALAAASRAAATTAAPGAPPAAAGSPPPGSAPPAVIGAPVRRGFPGNPPPRPQPAVPTASAPVATATTPPTGEQAGVLRRRGESMFRGLDRNRDGSIDADEWSRSRTLKPLFEQRGIDLTRPMSQRVFLDTYVQLNPN